MVHKKCILWWCIEIKVLKITENEQNVLQRITHHIWCHILDNELQNQVFFLLSSLQYVHHTDLHRLMFSGEQIIQACIHYMSHFPPSVEVHNPLANCRNSEQMNNPSIMQSFFREVCARNMPRDTKTQRVDIFSLRCQLRGVPILSKLPKTCTQPRPLKLVRVWKATARMELWYGA